MRAVWDIATNDAGGVGETPGAEAMVSERTSMVSRNEQTDLEGCQR